MLEQAIAENTAAIRELIAVLIKDSGAIVRADAPRAESQPEKVEAPKVEPVKAEAPKAEAAPAPAPTATVSADEVKAKFMAADRDHKLAALKSIGAARFSDVKPEQFAALAAALEA